MVDYRFKHSQNYGILNLTPDSFSDGGKFNNEKTALLHAENCLKQEQIS